MSKVERIAVGHCHSCRYRHDCCPHDYPDGEKCRHWKLGDCYTCKHLDAPDDEWFKRGCEAWCFGGCKKYKRDWKKTFQFMRIKGI